MVVKILFRCVGNSCRSQMAEAFTRRLGKGRIAAWSAGSSPLGWIAPYTFMVMEENGVSLNGQWSKRLQDVPAAEMDLVVFMGPEVICALPAGFKGRRAEWEIPDPFGAPVELYREVRDLIEKRVRTLLDELGAAPAKG